MARQGFCRLLVVSVLALICWQRAWAAEAAMTCVCDPTPPDALCVLVGDGWDPGKPEVAGSAARACCFDATDACPIHWSGGAGPITDGGASPSL